MIGLSSLILSSKTRLRTAILGSINWEGLSTDETLESLIAYATEIDNGEEILQQFIKHFDVPKKQILLFKLRILAQRYSHDYADRVYRSSLMCRQQWPLFATCAQEAIRGGGLHGLNYSGSTSMSQTRGGVSMALSAIKGMSSSGAEGGVQDQNFLRERQSTKMATKSQLAATFSGVFQVLNGRSNLTQTFEPLLPMTSTANLPAADTVRGYQIRVEVCPKLVPVSSYKNLNVLDFVSIASSHGRPDIAIALVPYIQCAVLREKWGLFLTNMKEPAEVETFCRNAIDCALVRANPSSATNFNAHAQVALLTDTFQTALAKKAQTHNPFLAHTSSNAHTTLHV